MSRSGSQVNLKDVLNGLKSTKIIDRQKALASFRAVFERPNFVNNFSTDPRAWVSVFQALFETVLTEKLAVTKKETSKSSGSSATASKRLEEAASTVRWLTERTVRFMNRRVTKPIFEHLLQTMVHRGELVAPVALQYIKALRCLVSYTPHMEHMEDDTWVRIVEMGFNILLEDPIKSTFSDDTTSPSPEQEADDSDLFDEDDSEDDALPSTSRKRPRSNSHSPDASPIKPSPQIERKARPTTRPTRLVSVSLEQVEFMSLLSTLLRSPSSPILSQEYPHLASSILVRLQRFLDLYTADASLVYDYVVALSSTLSHLSLNRIAAVSTFARKAWGGLIGLWGTKNKRIKEGLVSVLRILFPFVVSDHGPRTKPATSFDCVHGLRTLHKTLRKETESRSGIEGLSLECLRLEITDNRGDRPEVSAFIASTFRYGWNFDSNQGLAWAIHELQADCIAKVCCNEIVYSDLTLIFAQLFQLSESIHVPPTPGPTSGEGKRKRFSLENPINPIEALRKSIKQSASNAQVYHLQILMFLIDRHWHILHGKLQQGIIQDLIELVSLDDGIVQSWVFLCFGAIAFSVASPLHAMGNSTHPPTSRKQDTVLWETIWATAIRRTNVPVVSRAACHTAYILLAHTHARKDDYANIALPSNKVLSEIESLAKDLDVQGPPYPFDSVCTFLACCLRVASQDMHLYRMQLEEKVLTWLVDSWKVAGFRSKTLSPYMVKDVMLLLESICSLGKRTDLVSRVPLPEGQIVDVLVDEAKTQVIRDFVLAARLPPFRSAEIIHGTESSSYQNSAIDNDRGLIPPRGRERRITAFLLKSLQRLLSDWEDNTSHSPAETARQSMDMAVVALSFESVLVLNGTEPDRRLIQAACKLVGIITALLTDARWTPGEKAFIALGLDPLTFIGDEPEDVEPWSAMVPPDDGSGIKAQTLSQLSSCRTDGSVAISASRMSFLRIVWQNPDVQNAFGMIDDSLRSVLRITLGERPSFTTGPDAMDVDEHDDFGAIRTATEQHATSSNELTGHESRIDRLIVDICISFLTVGPTLQSAAGEPTRDKDLMDVILNTAEHRPEAFMAAFPVILGKCRQRILNISTRSLDSLLDQVSRLLALYQYSRSHRLQTLVTQFLASTLDIWASPSVAIGDVLDKFHDLFMWLAGALEKKKLRAWAVRDLLARFFDQYLVKDVAEHAWNPEEEEESQLPQLPSSLLPMMGADDDMRVRFRVAVINARLFAVARHAARPNQQVYVAIQGSLTRDLASHELMLTRILSLGNIMIACSAVRRGAYWHLLEACLHTSMYTAHIEAVLRGVSLRMGLVDFSSLFEAYASQLAYSIRQSDSDFLRFPPHLLGYQDRKECAVANFRSFTPTNIWNNGRRLFENHCKVISKSIDEGIRDCFGDIIGYQIVTYVDRHDTNTDALGPLLRSMTFDGAEFDQCLAQNVDAVAASILRSIGDQDFSEKGPIIVALRNVDETGVSVATFRSLTRYRRIEDFDLTHPPNLPQFPAETVFQALQWLRSEAVELDDKATTYHILRQLFADVDRSPLVYEQIRFVNALCLWIAIHPEAFQEITLLYTLIHGATALLGQSDLARAAQSIIDWALSCYRKFQSKDSRIPDTLVRICCLAYDYSQASHVQHLRSMGAELLEWIDIQAYQLAQVPWMSSQVMQALPAWPHQPSPRLLQLCESITSEHLSSALGDYRITSSKFRLVRRLRDYTISGAYSDHHFAPVDFWRLKECIPPSDQLQDADIDAFADLLALNKGHLDSFGGESSRSTSILGRHLRSKIKDREFQKEPIILTLMSMVQGDSTSQSNAAYETLRLIKSADNLSTSASLKEYRTELEYVAKYRRSPRCHRHCNIDDLVTDEQYLDSVGDFPRWVTGITTLLSDVLATTDAFYAQVIPILQSDTWFAEQILATLVYTLVADETSVPDAKDAPHRRTLSQFFTSVLSSSFASIRCLRSVIDVILHLRHFHFQKPQNPPDPNHDPLSYNKWLDVDFFLLAQRSITCGVYTTALLFLELASEASGSSLNSSQEILYEIYRHIDEPDGFYGIHDADLHQNLLRRFHHENQWERAFRFHGAAIEAGDAIGHAEGLVKSFHSFGFDHLANDALRTASSLIGGGSYSGSRGITYQLAWRTDTWDLPECDEQVAGASLYHALRAIHRERDERSVDIIVRKSLSREMARLRALGSENFAEIREVIQDLMCLREVAKWRQDPFQSCLASRDLSMGKWDHFVEIDQTFNFYNLESIMATRISLVRSSRHKEQRQQIGALVGPFAQGLTDVETQCLVRLSKAARAAGKDQVALNSIIRSQKLQKVPSFGVFEEFANVLWCQKEEKIAVESLQRLAQSNWLGLIRDTPCDHDKALVLSRLGSWSSAACLRKPEDIQKEYFKAAIDSLPNIDGSSSSGARGTHATVYHECAMFAERHYHQIVKSPDALRWKIYVDRKQQEITARGEELKKLACNSQEWRKVDSLREKADKQLQSDQESFRRHNVSRDAFLKQAIDMYSRALQDSDFYDGDAIIRLCSLWFTNFDNDATGLQEKIKGALKRIPSRKFVVLSHQLSARIWTPLTTADDVAPTSLPVSQSILQSLILRMCKEHPFHCTYQVYCLQPERPDKTSRRKSGRMATPSSVQTERSIAAGNIFDRLRREPSTAERLRDIEKLSNVCLEWATYPIKNNPKYPRNKTAKLPTEASIGKITNLRVPVMTHHTPLDPTMQYSDCPWIDHFETSFKVANGNGVPKITDCIGTNGVTYKQLFKGEGGDDLRQDAVMEQVFSLVNDILHHDTDTRRRLLNVRDYRVIPLTPQAGVLEFVGDTLPLNGWLPLAHSRYHPNDLPHKAIYPALQKAREEHEDLTQKVAAFEALQKKVRPVMRHFFTEKHKIPMAWFAMRLNYTRSVATTSIVGHVLGLGDRHISNILIDNVSGQLVHIDLGIAFDQGRLLPVPELVPFRMTRDMIDGMGMSGTAGVFQRCAEETLRVLRDGSEVVMTVLEVFKHDPLHSWHVHLTASETKIKRVQGGASASTTNTARPGIDIGIDMSSGSAEEAADRALSSVARKLDKSLSVQTVVNQLVTEATDTRNLAQIFHGWGPLY
ncbi:hypothetical protein DXG03_007732 [Asterophora parasitica]|uniref:Serine/threonine-protein kinase Tel1 n=1 Tax=Asterophora parasitica TaxID=117018 RepID=A0A9P7GEH6_9AGAR|nr:hypothetical protein DXG03_007732 [Asterophora parasitica]